MWRAWRSSFNLSFQHFADQLGCPADEDPTLVAFTVFFDLLGVFPIDPGDVPAEDGTICFFEASQNLFCIEICFPAVPGFTLDEPIFQADRRQSANDGATSLPIAAQSAAECTHGPHQTVVIYPEFFLPDRENGLASMQSIHQQLSGFFLHFIRYHKISPSPFYFYVLSKIVAGAMPPPVLSETANFV